MFYLNQIASVVSIFSFVLFISMLVYLVSQFNNIFSVESALNWRKRERENMRDYISHYLYK